MKGSPEGPVRQVWGAHPALRVSALGASFYFRLDRNPLYLRQHENYNTSGSRRCRSPPASACPRGALRFLRDGDGDDVSFVLNESADSVKVVFDEGASTMVIGTSPEPAGTKTFSKAGRTSYRIEVEKNAGPGWKSGVLQQISQDSNDLVKFANGRGVAVNRLPNTGPLFGRIYTTVATTGTAAPVVIPPVPSRATTEGIYVLNADFSATALGSGPLLGGLTFDTATTGAEGPYRLSIGAGGDLFITDWTDTNGSVYKTDGNVAEGKNVLGGPVGLIAPATTNFPLGATRIHGSIPAVVTEGSEAAGDLKLWVIDEDLQTNPEATTQSIRNSIWLWDMANVPLPIISPPVDFASAAASGSIGIGFASQTSDLTRSSDGTFYKLQRRSAGAESGIFAVGADGIRVASHPAAASVVPCLRSGPTQRIPAWRIRFSKPGPATFPRTTG